MFYSPINKLFLEKIKSAKKILTATHQNPDYDSIASVLALKDGLKQLNKNVEIISCQKINPDLLFLKGSESITPIDFQTFDFSYYDLFIVVDASSDYRITGSKKVSLPKNLDYLIIDHHLTNDFNYPAKLVDEEAVSTTEIIYRLFQDFKLKINPYLATVILTGILGDSVFLRYTENRQRTMKTVFELVNLGADMDLIEENFFENFDFQAIKLLGMFLNKMKKEESSTTGKKNFVWSAISFEEYKKYHFPEGVREMAADLFFRGIKNVDFGLAILEQKPKEIFLSFRSKKDFDVSQLAKIFGGGGHRNAAGANILGNFKTTVKQIINKLKKTVK